MFPRRRSCPAGLALLLVVSISAAPCQAQDKKFELAARFLPAETAFYSSSLRLKQQFDIVAKSRAWKAIVEKYGLDAEGGALEKWDEIRKNDDYADIYNTVEDLLSHEFFWAGSESIADLGELFSRVQQTNQYNGFVEGLKGNKGAQDPQETSRMALRALLAHRELIQAPELIIGFKVNDPKRAANQIDRLHGLLAIAGLNTYVKAIKIRGAKFLSAELDGDMIPWDQIPINDLAEKDGEFDPLVKKLKSLKLTINHGVMDGYVLASIGPSNAFLEKFGGPGRRLIEAPEFQPVRNHTAKPITKVGYASKSFRIRTGATGFDLDEAYGQYVDQIPAEAATPEVRKKIRQMLKSASKQTKVDPSAIGGEMNFSFLTDRGYESFQYDWSKHPEIDDSKPLTLTNHVGGSAILAFVSRTPSNPGDYEKFVTGIKDIAALVRESSSSWPADKKQEFDRFMKAGQPLFERLDKITGTMLVPALAEGQSAIVFDAKWTSARWHKDMPVFEKPLPMPEIALVFGVSDPALLEKAMQGYGKLIEDAFVTAREQAPKDKAKEIPDFKFPPPVVKKTAAGKIWTWPLPKDLGVDVRVAPTLGLSDKLGVAAASEDHVQRVLKSTPLAGDSKLLVGIEKRKVASIVVFDFARLIDAIDPWAEFIAADQLRKQGRQEEAAQILEGMRIALTTLKCYRGTTTITYHEGTGLRDPERVELPRLAGAIVRSAGCRHAWSRRHPDGMCAPSP